MTPEQHTAILVKICSITRELCACIDAMGQAEEIQRLPDGDVAADAFLIHGLLEEAACAADTAATHVGDLLTELDRLGQEANLAAASFLGAGGKEGTP